MPDVRGNYNMFTSDGKNYSVIINGDAAKPSGTLKSDTTKRKLNITFKNTLATFTFEYDSVKTARLNGNYNADLKSFTGKGQWANGRCV